MDEDELLAREISHDGSDDIDEEDESENVNKKEVEAIADIEDTVGDVDMRTKKMEALDKTK